MKEPLSAQRVVFRKWLPASESFYPTRSSQAQPIWILWLSILAVGISKYWMDVPQIRNELYIRQFVWSHREPPVAKK